MSDWKQLRDALRKALAEMARGVRRNPMRDERHELRQAEALRQLKRLH
ncbi:MAG: hypothetical protein JOZ93_12425 [Sinobacteraceae bacterium]|nr:hypothetical protein [Nevskiaceae bacterium]